MRTVIAIIFVLLAPFAQAQDVIPAEVIYDEFPLPGISALARPEKGRAIPRDRRTARPVRLPGSKEVNRSPQTKRPPAIKLASAKATRMFTAFERKLRNIWVSPHGEAMKAILRDIAAAEEAGDTETYKALTATYAVWAEKYLRRGAQPSLKQNP